LNTGNGYFSKFDDWIIDAISNARQEEKDITMNQI
jgi:hypothetical protein